MVELKVFRKNNRCYIDTLEQDIEQIWNSPAVRMRDSVGVPSDYVTDIATTFRYVVHFYQKNYGIQNHVLQIRLINEVENEASAWEIFSAVSEYYGYMFQHVLTMSVCDGIYICTFLINAVSYRSGEAFYDNNKQYQNLMQMLQKRFGFENMSFRTALFTGTDSDADNFTG